MKPRNMNRGMNRTVNSNTHGQGGAMLIEALVAITIFSFGILAVVGMLTVHMGTANDARFRVEAAQFAESVISEMRLTDPATRAADYAVEGARLQAWTDRITGEGGLPLVGVGEDVVPLNIEQDGGTVTVTVNWLAAAEVTPTDLAANTATPHRFVITSFID